MNLTQADIDYCDDLRRRADEPMATPVQNVRKWMGFDVQEVGSGSFLEGIKRLKEGTANALVGPRGGLYVIGKYDHLVYQRNPKMKITFDVNDLLAVWCFVQIDGLTLPEGWEVS